MPIYVYKCKHCDYQFELIVPVSRKDRPACPKCKRKDEVGRLWDQTAPGIINVPPWH